MNKEKYLKELERRLEFLTKEQRQNEIFRVSNELDNFKIVNDISKEVEEIYKKYKIDINKKIKKANNKYLIILDNVSTKISYFVNNMKKNTLKQNLIIIRDILIIFFTVSIYKILFLSVQNILFSVLGNAVPNIVMEILYFIIEISYVIFALLIFNKMFKKRFQKELGIENE